jgi:hypothetical protein
MTKVERFYFHCPRGCGGMAEAVIRTVITMDSSQASDTEIYCFNCRKDPMFDVSDIPLSMRGQEILLIPMSTCEQCESTRVPNLTTGDDICLNRWVTGIVSCHGLKSVVL